MPRQPPWQLLEQGSGALQGLAPARGPVQLRSQAAVAEEPGPIHAPAVALGGGTDPVVLLPAIGTAGFGTAAMQQRQRGPETMPGPIAARRSLRRCQRQPIEHQHGPIPQHRTSQRLRDPQR